MRHLIYKIVHLFSNLFVKKNKLKYDLIIVKPDALGDFSIFTPFLYTLLDQEYAEKRVLFIGNVACRDLASAFKLQNNLNFLWLDRRKFSRDLFYRFRKELLLQTISCKKLICPIYQDDQYTADYIVRAIYGRSKITMRLNEDHLLKSLNDKIYSKIILSKLNRAFEIDLHNNFLTEVFKKNFSKTLDKAPINSVDINIFDLPDSYYVVFIGASDCRRRWPIKRYIQLCKTLEKIYIGTPVFCGSMEDSEGIHPICFDKLNSSINIIGQTTMSQLVKIISKADYLISNESCAPHIANVSGCKKSYVISNGNHLGRFCPYPSSVYPGYDLLLPPEIIKKRMDTNFRHDLYFNGHVGDIKNISVENVFKKISESLND